MEPDTSRTKVWVRLIIEFHMSLPTAEAWLTSWQRHTAKQGLGERDPDWEQALEWIAKEQAHNRHP